MATQQAGMMADGWGQVGKLAGSANRAADEETASTTSNACLSEGSHREDEGACEMCGLVLAPGVAAAGDGMRYCDVCWVLCGGVARIDTEPKVKALPVEQPVELTVSAPTASQPVACPTAVAVREVELPTLFKCTECNVEVPRNAAQSADGMKYCEECWRKALPLPVKRVQPKRSPGLAPKPSALGLQPSFFYAGGLGPHPAKLLFDVRDEVCLQVGGFRHGEVVCDAAGREFAAVGVHLAGDTPRLWFQPRDLGRPGAGAFPGLSSHALRGRLHPTGQWQQLDQWILEGTDEAEDAEGELTLLCRHCRLPVGDFAYEAGEDQEGGVAHGECLAELVLKRAREADEARERSAVELKNQLRAQHGLGWKPENIPCSMSVAQALGCGSLPQGLCCLVLDEDSQTISVRETYEPAAAVNLEYLSLALQVRRALGTEAWFSLDPVVSADGLRHRTQVKHFEPEWLAGTSVGEIMFQADYLLKELSMGEHEQPVLGMKSCFDLADSNNGDRAWNAREWFVVRKAQVQLSEDGVLVPRVCMGVEAREQEEGCYGLTDKPMTRPDHPLVRYAESFTQHFDLIAERKSAVFQLREVAKASVLAKFLDDTSVALEESWFSAVATCTQGSCAEIPQLWNERCSSHVAVEAGRILEAKDGIRRGKHGVYGGVQMQVGLEEVVSAGTYRQRMEAGRMLPQYMSIRVPQPSRFAPQGVDLNLNRFDLSSPAREPEPHMSQPSPEGSGTWGYLSVGCEAALGSKFWSMLRDPGSPLSGEDKVLLQSVFHSHLSDRRAEGERFIPPDTSATYIQSLRLLVSEEDKVRSQRLEHFTGDGFEVSKPGPLFPSGWAVPFSLARRCEQGHLDCLSTADSTLAVEDLAASDPVFDKTTEDGLRLRVYRPGPHEVRTVQEPTGDEVISAVFVAKASLFTATARMEREDVISKVTEYVYPRPAAEAGALGFGLFLVLEAESGGVITVEKLLDGSLAWEENPVDLEHRISLAKAVRMAEGAGLSVAELQDCCNEKASSDCSSKCFAQGIFALAGGAAEAVSSGFWQKSNLAWQLPQGRATRHGRWQDGCWEEQPMQAAWWAQDWQQEWQQGGKPGAVAVARRPAASAKLQLPSTLRQQFESR